METTAAVNDHQGTAAPTAAETGVLVETTTTVATATLTRIGRKRVKKVTDGGDPKELSDRSSSSSSSSSSSDKQNNTYLRI